MSNGQLLAVTKNGDQKTWHYLQKDPMSSYLIAIAIDRYDSVRTYSNQGVPLIKYYYPERAGDLPHYYRHNEEIFNFLQNEIRVPYPWPNYKQAPVQDFRHGAMENTTATIFGDFFLVDSIAYADGNYTYVNAHELAHQWFGNYVTATGSKHHWLHEGFATYYQWLSEGNLYGQDFFDWERYKAFNMIKAANLVDQHPLGHPQAGAARFYQKGGWVLYMLRNQIGDEVYTRAIADYLNRYAYGLVSTDSLRLVLEEHCSCSLKPFFDYWVFESGEPELKAWQSDSKLYLSLTRGKWLSNLMLEFWQGDSSSLRQLRAGDLKRGDTLSLDLPYPHWRILNIDRYLVETNFSKSQANWLAQYQRSEGLLESYRCLQSAADSHDQNKQAWLETIIADSTAYYPLRAKALEQLLELPVTAQQKWLWYWQTLMGEDWQLRRQILAMAPEKNPRLDSVLAEWRTQAPSYDLRFDALRMSLKPDQLESNRWLYDPIWKEYPGIPDQRIYISVLAYRYLLFQDQEALSELIDRAGISFDFLTRMKAIETLAGLKQTSEAAMQTYFTAFFNANWKLRKTAREQLDLIAQQQPEYFKAYMQKAQKNWTPLQKHRVEKRYDLLPKL
jgi:aminopeptidase N